MCGLLIRRDVGLCLPARCSCCLSTGVTAKRGGCFQWCLFVCPRDNFRTQDDAYSVQKFRPSSNVKVTEDEKAISIEYRHSVTIAYVDFSKAFDSVCHNKLFVSLASYGTRWLYCVECPQYSTRRRSASDIHRSSMLRKIRQVWKNLVISLLVYTGKNQLLRIFH